MKLLFDENVSQRLAHTLADAFPGSSHVTGRGLTGSGRSSDLGVRPEEGFAIVSKDTDFLARGYVEGAPPKVVWLDVGNAATKAIEELLRREAQRVDRFVESEGGSVLILSLGQAAV